MIMMKLLRLYKHLLLLSLMKDLKGVENILDRI